MEERHSFLAVLHQIFQVYLLFLFRKQMRFFRECVTTSPIINCVNLFSLSLFLLWTVLSLRYLWHRHPTCDTNHSPLCWIQDVPGGGLGAFDPLVFGQVPGQGVSRTGGAAPIPTDLLLWASLTASVFTGRHLLWRHSGWLTAWPNTG